MVHGGAHASLTDCVIKNNSAAERGGGLLIGDVLDCATAPTYAVLRDCVVEGNSVNYAPAGLFGSTQVGGGGMFVGDLGGGNVTIAGSLVRDNEVPSVMVPSLASPAAAACSPAARCSPPPPPSRITASSSSGSYTEDDSLHIGGGAMMVAYLGGNCTAEDGSRDHTREYGGTHCTNCTLSNNSVVSNSSVEAAAAATRPSPAEAA